MGVDFYSPDQPRDERGRWGEGGGESPAQRKAVESYGHKTERPDSPVYNDPHRQAVESLVTGILAESGEKAATRRKKETGLDAAAAQVGHTYQPHEYFSHNTNFWLGNDNRALVGTDAKGRVFVTGGSGSQVPIPSHLDKTETEYRVRTALRLKTSDEDKAKYGRPKDWKLRDRQHESPAAFDTRSASPAHREVNAMSVGFYSPDQPRDDHGRWGDGGGATAAPAKSGESNKAFERRIGGHVEDRPADPRYHSPLRQGIEAHAVTLLTSAKLRDVPHGDVTLTFKPRYAMTTVWRGDHALAHIGPAPDGGVTVSPGIANSRKRDVVIHPETPPAEAEGLLRRALGLKPSRFASFAASPSRTMERAIDSGRDRMQELAEQLQAGTLTLGQWQQASTAELKSLHIMGALAGTGGDTLDAGQRQAVNAKLNEQTAYLWNLAGQIARGEQPLDGRFVARAGMYADAARNTFSEAERGQASADGMKWERRILNEAVENCPDCEEYAAQNWVPLGTLPAIGEGSRCLVHCACGFEYSDSAEQPADDEEPDEEAPPEEEEPDVPEPSEEEQAPIEEQLTEPVGNQPPSDDEMADRIVAAATDYLESGPIREPRHQVSDAQAHKRHIAGIVNRIDEISLDAAQKVHAALGLAGDGTTKAHIRRALAAYLRNGYAGFADADYSFCPTGQGGGVDPTCAPGGGAAKPEKKQATTDAAPKPLTVGEVKPGDKVERPETEHTIGGVFVVTAVDPKTGDLSGHELGEEDDYFIGNVREFIKPTGEAKPSKPKPEPAAQEKPQEKPAAAPEEESPSSLPDPKPVTPAVTTPVDSSHVKDVASLQKAAKADFGVEVSIIGKKDKANEVSAHVYEYLGLMKQSGWELPARLAIETALRSRAGFYDYKTDTVVLNSNAVKQYRDTGLSSSEVPGWTSVSRYGQPASSLVHETGHAEHAGKLREHLGEEKASAWFSDMCRLHAGGVATLDGLKVSKAGFKKAAAEVSEYAASAPVEFVAEVYVGKRFGKKYSNKVEALYASLGGP